MTTSIDRDMLLKLAKNLQSVHSKLTTGEPRKWMVVPHDERDIWMRVARTAARVLATDQSAA